MSSFAAMISTREVDHNDRDDQAFLFLLYRAGRAVEMAEWGWPSAAQEAFLRFQFDAQQRHYAASFPHTERMIVLEEEKAVGSLLVVPGGEHSDEPTHLVDIALLPERQRQGIGTLLIQQLKEEAQKNQHDVTLFVRGDNKAAIRLYERLGFRYVGEGKVLDTAPQYSQMRWRHQRDQRESP